MGDGSYHFLQTPPRNPTTSDVSERPQSFPCNSLGSGHHNPHRPRSASVSPAEVDSSDSGQHCRNSAQAHSNCAQHASLAMRVVTVENCERRMQRQLKLFDGAIVLNFYQLELHQPFPLDRRYASTAHCAPAAETPPTTCRHAACTSALMNVQRSYSLQRVFRSHRRQFDAIGLPAPCHAESRHTRRPR